MRDLVVARRLISAGKLTHGRIATADSAGRQLGVMLLTCSSVKRTSQLLHSLYVLHHRLNMGAGYSTVALAASRCMTNSSSAVPAA
jgi:hypothetical protein